MTRFRIAEQFDSINGEAGRAGELAHFVRFTGCNLHCSYCDTGWANAEDAPYKEKTAEEIYADILASGIRDVTLTGGEPLLQDGIEELLALLNRDDSICVDVETNGSVDVRAYIKTYPSISYILDYKLPGSGMEAYMQTAHYACLRRQDAVKFVAGSLADLERVKAVLETYQLIGRCQIFLSPVFGEIEPAEIVRFMLAHRLNDVRIQLQMHKMIWSPDKRGV